MLPREIINSTPKDDVVVVFVVFNESTLFPIREDPADGFQSSTEPTTIVGSPVVSVQVAGIEEGTVLDAPIELDLSLNQIENISETNVRNPVCVFWDFFLAGKFLNPY